MAELSSSAPIYHVTRIWPDPCPYPSLSLTLSAPTFSLFCRMLQKPHVYDHKASFLCSIILAKKPRFIATVETAFKFHKFYFNDEKCFEPGDSPFQRQTGSEGSARKRCLFCACIIRKSWGKYHFIVVKSCQNALLQEHMLSER